MKEKRIMDTIVQYLKEQKISYMQIKKDTKIDISPEKVLSSSEFLKLCDYLRKKPEEFAELWKGTKDD